ncbi:MAG TPA: hypothetical protein VIH76_07375 [Candidatus Acidoferrales bacterium]
MIGTVKVGELVVDYNNTARSAVNFAHVGALKNALLAGVVFPPIVAERSTRRIVDGLHRCKAYTQLWGEGHEIEVDFRDYANDNDLWMAAVEANNSHGLPYSTYDRTRILVEADRRGIKREVITSAMKMPIEKADKKILGSSAFVKTPVGQERVALRTGLKPLAGRQLTKAQLEANNKAGAMKAEYHCEALITLLRAGLLTWGSKNAVTMCGSLYKELDKRVERLAS